MKLNTKIQVKATKRLFMDKYQYKTVLVCPVGNWFRGSNIDYVIEKLQLIEGKKLPLDTPIWNKLKTKEDVEYCLKLCSLMQGMSNFEIRVEHPLLSFYTNEFKDIVSLSNADIDRVKYVAKPTESLEKNTVYLPKINYGFKVTMGRTRNSYDSFVNWATNNNKIKLTKSVVSDLKSNRSWGGNYFYVKDEKSLTMVKMFLGSEISRIDRVISDPPA